MNDREPDTEHWGPSLGPVVLDIGGDVGAAVVLAPAHLEGAELEIRRPPEPWDGRHVAVRARPGSGDPVLAAVFSGLLGGCYELRVRGLPDAPVRRVVVRGEDVVVCQWADPASAGAAGTDYRRTDSEERRPGRKEHSRVG